ncbi:MAG: tail fiber domain-containing protein [Xanthomonadales bacterium]|nr:tail fiber domain-containing protein [Xanthomonadales bacterium]
MSRRFASSLLHAALLAALLPAAHAGEFVYQGQLDDRGQPANGRYDLRIAAYTDEKSASGLMAPIEFSSVEVKDGRFELRFDAPLAKDREAWLEVAVRDAGSAAYASLPGRSKAISAPLIGACWSATGDAGSNPATNFLGTTDAQPLVLRTANVQSLRIEPSAELFEGLPITANVIAGSRSNYTEANVRGATIAGGGVPFGNSDPEFSNDFPNYVGDHYGTVGGGFGNKAGDYLGTVGDRAFATVAGGYRNGAGGLYGMVGGGEINNASGESASVGGGHGNSASHLYSTVPGGSGNCAGGESSFAAGHSAKVRVGSSSGYAGFGCSSVAASGDANGDEGTFAWADSQVANFVSTGPNQFLIRAQNGVAINTNAPEVGAALTVAGSAVVQSPGALSFGSATRQMLNLFGTSYGIGVQSDTQYFRSGGNGYFAWFRGGVHSNTGLDPGAGGSLLMTLGPAASTPTGTARAQSFTNVSDRASKTGFEPIDASDVLTRVTQLPLSQWSYRNEPSVRHLGPVAQDFRAAFGLGEDERTISTVDSAGVALAAIQGLNAKLEAENAAKDNEIAVLRQDLAALRALVESRLRGER